MDHKTLFERYGNESIADLAMLDGFTVEDLYQAFKARMIEELRVRPGQSEVHADDNGEWLIQEYATLCDTTKDTE